MCGTWQRLNPEARVHLAYGGSADTFALLTWADRTFINDARLRTRDPQRERQSYCGVMKAVIGTLSGSTVDRVLMVECDVVPLKEGLVNYLLQRECEEKADVMGVRLQRVDGTGHPHVLAHEFHAGFDVWLENPVRPGTKVVLMMLGCLTWWKWEAFVRTAEVPEPLPVYLELAMPTTAHQLGFRVRDLPEFVPDVESTGELDDQVEERRKKGRWVLHPCKTAWKRPR